MRFLLVYVLLSISLAACSNNPTNAYETPTIDSQKSPEENARDSGDVMRSLGDKTTGLLKDPSLTAVSAEFGLSLIHMKQLPFHSELAIAKTVPWSSWWFPKKEKTLFDDTTAGGMSALKKYDLFRSARVPGSGSAADYERKSFKPNSLSWEGLCDAWSIASITSPEPKHPVIVKFADPQKSITFDIVDLKALLLKTYEAVDDTTLKYYGQKFTGDEDGWVFPDMFPDQFHRFLEVQLFERKLPFIMDHDPGPEVWNVPVYKANYSIEAVPGSPNSVLVKSWVFSAEQVSADDKSFVGTREASREYNYILTGVKTSSGDLRVNAGYWIKTPHGVDSRRDHPDYITTIPNPSKIVRKSWNPEIDIKLVDEILSYSY